MGTGLLFKALPKGAFSTKQQMLRMHWKMRPQRMLDPPGAILSVTKGTVPMLRKITRIELFTQALFIVCLLWVVPPPFSHGRAVAFEVAGNCSGRLSLGYPHRMFKRVCQPRISRTG